MIYVAPYILASHGRLHGGDDPVALLILGLTICVIMAVIWWDLRK